MREDRRSIKVAIIGGGSQPWSPKIIRDIIFKPGMEQVHIDFHLLDVHEGRSNAMARLFAACLPRWGVDWATVSETPDPTEALSGADFVIITISTGRLPAMRHDLEIPEKYSIYHTVGDTAGPGGWSRALRNIPVFKAYADQMSQIAPNAFVINYTNPMGALTKVLADTLGTRRVVGLCHGLFECYAILRAIFGLDSERQVRIRFGGLNHFFWVLGLALDGHEGYEMIRQKARGRNFAELIMEAHEDGMGFSSNHWVAGELFDHYGYLPYVGDRHICEFFDCYITDPAVMERYKLVRTSIADRESMYQKAAERIDQWTVGEPDGLTLSNTPSRETAADIVRAVTFEDGFVDVVNTVNVGQISSLPLGAVVETMGYIDAEGVTPLAVGPLPDSLNAVLLPHAQVQVRTVNAGLAGNLDEAFLALAEDPLCAHLTVSDVKRMGMELLEANSDHLPQFQTDARKTAAFAGR